jgi:molecular chaperone DnaK
MYLGRVIGIDLGTTNSAMATLENGRPIIIPNSLGRRLTPSAVAFSKDGELLVGDVAKNQAVLNPERTVLSVKRKMGTDYRWEMDGRSYRPEEIAAMILRKLKSDAEAYLGEEVEGAVITAPAYFNDRQRQATVDAGKIAGLTVLRIVNEPTAAALAYGLDKGEEGLLLVVDFGGGTFDVSLLEVGDGVFEVKATSGDNQLGGDDFDRRILYYIASDFKGRYGIDLTSDRMSAQKLVEASERAKIELSETTSSHIGVPFITADENGPVHLDVDLSRSKLEELIEDLAEKMVGPIRQAVSDAKVSMEDIDRVILVGGSTRVPLVREVIEDVTGHDLYKGVNPDECVALGAAIQSGVITGRVKGIVLVDVTPLSLGVETEGGLFVPIIERNAAIPTEATKIFSTIADGQPTVEIHVLQGERKMAADNISLGRFHLTGIGPAPRGVPRIEVTFDIDADGIVHVSAADADTGSSEGITITSAKGLSQEEIDRMIRQAKEHEPEDRRRQNAALLVNRAEMAIYRARRKLKFASARIKRDVAVGIEEAIADLEDALGEGGIDGLEATTASLVGLLDKVR